MTSISIVDAERILEGQRRKCRRSNAKIKDPDDYVRELILLSDTQALNISKNDVIALAKEFGLVVYNQGDNL
jgi:hypothetical protein